MAGIFAESRFPDENRKFLNTPLGAFIADQLERGGLESLNTQHRFTAALLSYTRNQRGQYYSIISSMHKKPSPSLNEAIQRSVIPWDAPPLTPDERSVAIVESSLMGKSIVLDSEECPFQKQDK